MPSQIRARRQPCTGCGDTVVIIERDVSGLGGLWRLKAQLLLQHADPSVAGEVADGVDSDCRRRPVRTD